MNRMYHAVLAWMLRTEPPRRFGFPRPGIEILEDRLAPTGNLAALLGLNQIQAAYPAATGAGYTVALLDTGINYNLPSLGGGIGPGYRVVYGYNFVDNTTNALDDNGHGTFLANMIGSSNPSDLGIAPKVQFADLKVLDSNMNGPWSAVENALQWVIANKYTYNIVAVNLSLGSGNYTSDQFSILENDLADLKNMGVFIAAASGNNYATDDSQPGLSYPAVDPDVVSVGATWAGSYGAQTVNGATDNSTTLNQLASFTQRDNALSILAPGAWITTIGMNGSETTLGGTSMATAVVTGAAVLLHEVLDQTGQSGRASEQGILQLMQSTGTAVIDNSTSANVTPTGLTFAELNLPAALAAAEPVGAPTLGPIANQTMQAGQTLSVALPITRAASDPVTFSTQITDLPLLAYQLDQEYSLTSSGNYYTNEFGYDEKWLTDGDNHWFWLLPDGEFRRYDLTPAATLEPANLLATLNGSYYANPALLWNAPAVTKPTATLSVSGNTLSIQSPGSWTGAFTISVTASDGQHSPITESFTVTVNPAPATPPTLAPVVAQTMNAGQTTLTIPLSVGGGGSGTLTYQAAAQTPSATAYQLNQLYAFQPANAAYYYNLTGHNEKWLIGKNNQWYALLPNGNLYRWDNSITQTLTAANLVATLDPSVYTEPRLLWNANPPVAPALTFTFQGNQLVIQRPTTLTGVFFITITVSVGSLTSQCTFELTFN